jgi:dihydrofolate reductase
MAYLIYSAITSLDGYVADEAGNFDWSKPDEEVHAFVNELERPLGTHLYGRRMYEVLVAWETMDLTDEPQVIHDYAEIWRTAEKVVFSRTLSETASARTRIEPEFDPVAIARLKEVSDQDISVGGPTLAAQALAAGLVDECHLLVSPVSVGGGTRALPEGLKLSLELRDERRFANGVVYLRYAVRRAP